MINAAGDLRCDQYIPLELTLAGLSPVQRTSRLGEVPSNFMGKLDGWVFVRNWNYWVACGSVLPFKYANPLHELIGTEVRVAGHCGCPSPEEWHGEKAKQEALADFNSEATQSFFRNHPEMGKPVFEWPDGIDTYHIDTQEGLNIFVAVLKKYKRDRDSGAFLKDLQSA